MDIYSIGSFILCICFLFFFGRYLIIPIRTVLKIIINSFLGAILILIVNCIGSLFNFSIGINIFTSVFVGILGIPGAILLIIMKMVL